LFGSRTHRAQPPAALRPFRRILFATQCRGDAPRALCPFATASLSRVPAPPSATAATSAG